MNREDFPPYSITHLLRVHDTKILVQGLNDTVILVQDRS